MVLPPPCFFLMLVRPPRSTLFPYTTLSRSLRVAASAVICPALAHEPERASVPPPWARSVPVAALLQLVPLRSEVPTSELASRDHWLCSAPLVGTPQMGVYPTAPDWPRTVTA